MIKAMCEFDSIAAKPEGPEIWIALSETIDSIATTTLCPRLKEKLIAVAGDTVERHHEAIDCYGRPIHTSDISDAQNVAYQSILDAMVSLEAVDTIDPIIKASTMTQLAVVAADIRGEWMCLPA